jgi:hypothetical protein
LKCNVFCFVFFLLYPRKRGRDVAEFFQSRASARSLARRGKKRVRSSFFDVETQVSGGAILNEQTPTEHGISTTRACLEPRAHNKATTKQQPSNNKATTKQQQSNNQATTRQLPHAPFHLQIQFFNSTF